jgi:hypothetical protein
MTADDAMHWWESWTTKDRARAEALVALAQARYGDVSFYATRGMTGPTLQGNGGQRLLSLEPGALYATRAFGSLPDDYVPLKGLATPDRVVALSGYRGRGRA